ncbi:MAG: ATP-binding domain-containing protein, partial [Burkholderiales bacterium]|nr:ATP-binding domain-containing protein [Burkholderiales bacterium]
LGPHPLRAFTGRYDLFGNPDYSDGETVLESVYRFKGQSAPCVILTEIDFEAWDERSLRKLFVGATRATLKLVLILSERADRLLREHPTNPGLTNTIPRTLP